MMPRSDVATLAPEASTGAPAVVPGSAGETCCKSAAPPGAPHDRFINKRRVLAVAGMAAAGAGVALGWDWLTAIGIAPLLVATAPCLIMCALGLCMMGRGKESRTEQAAPRATGTTAPQGGLASKRRQMNKQRASRVYLC